MVRRGLDRDPRCARHGRRRKAPHVARAARVVAARAPHGRGRARPGRQAVPGHDLALAHRDCGRRHQSAGRGARPGHAQARAVSPHRRRAGQDFAPVPRARPHRRRRDAAMARRRLGADADLAPRRLRSAVQGRRPLPCTPRCARSRGRCSSTATAPGRTAARPAMLATARVPAQHQEQLAPLLRLIAVERGAGSFELNSSKAPFKP